MAKIRKIFSWKRIDWLLTEMGGSLGSHKDGGWRFTFPFNGELLGGNFISPHEITTDFTFVMAVYDWLLEQHSKNQCTWNAGPKVFFLKHGGRTHVPAHGVYPALSGFKRSTGIQGPLGEQIVAAAITLMLEQRVERKQTR